MAFKLMVVVSLWLVVIAITTAVEYACDRRRKRKQAPIRWGRPPNK